MTPAASVIQRARDFALGFLQENMPQSSARLIAIMCGGTACLCGVGTIVFAFINPTAWQTTTALGGTTVTSLGSVMAYALKVRKLSDKDCPPEAGGS